jgi:hypothetical protein
MLGRNPHERAADDEHKRHDGRGNGGIPVPGSSSQCPSTIHGDHIRAFVNGRMEKRSARPCATTVRAIERLLREAIEIGPETLEVSH